MQVFRFKEFAVSNEMSAQKVGTDGVLLGAAATLPGGDSVSVLDIGTGTGLVALMLAQRLSHSAKGFSITGIDIDSLSVTEAAANFADSPWAQHLSAEHIALADYRAAASFDLIVSNPPFYDNSLPAPELRRSAARHTESLSYREICTFASENLALGGRLSLILPSADERELLRYAVSLGLCPSMLLRIRTVASKPPRRLIAEFTRGRTSSPVGHDSPSRGGNIELPAVEGIQQAHVRMPGDNSRGCLCALPSAAAENEGAVHGGAAAQFEIRSRSVSNVSAPAVPARELTLMENGRRTPAYSALTEAFYL